ncbi:MAG: chemotaxis protein CheW [Planctomycetota bacterium]
MARNSTDHHGQTGEILQLVSFCVNDEHYAVDILRVQEINRMMQITQVPESPAGVEGIINLRGRIIPIMDLRVRFSMPTQERTEDSRIVVVDAAGTTVGFIVDRVHEVLRIESSTVDPAPEMSGTPRSRYVRGVAKRDDLLVILLDLDALLGEDTAESLAAMAV